MGASAATARAAVHEGRVCAYGNALLRRQTFIGLTVAVVVHHVASLGLGIDVAHAREVCSDALERTELAGHRIALTARRAYAVDVVDGAVAVVVDHVARFRGGHDRALAGAHTGNAVRHAELARANIGHWTARHPGITRVVVDHAVAIVVDTVAKFGGRIACADALRSTHHALLRAFFARKDVADAASHPDVGRVVIGLTVAIVVESVASLGHLSGHFDVCPDALVVVADASVRARVGNQPTDTSTQRFITETDRTDLHVTREVIGAIDQTIAIVVDGIAALLDAAVCLSALVFAPGGVRLIEIDITGETRSDLALRVCRSARFARHTRGRARGISIQNDAVVAAHAAVRGARTQVVVFVDLVVAVVVLVVADGVIVGVLDAVVLADAVLGRVQVVPTFGTTL